MVKIKSVLVVLIGLFFFILLLIGSTIFVTSCFSFYFKKTKNSHNAFKIKSNLVKQMFNICYWFSLTPSYIDFRYRKSTYIQFTNDSRIHSCYISIKVDVKLTIRDIYNKINDVVIFCWYFSMIKRRYVQKNMAFFSPVPLKVKAR